MSDEINKMDGKLSFRSQSSDPHFVWAVATLKRAAAELNSEFGLYEDQNFSGSVYSGEAIAQAIMLAADELINGRLPAPLAPPSLIPYTSQQQEIIINDLLIQRANGHLAISADSDVQPITVDKHLNIHQPLGTSYPAAVCLAAIRYCETMQSSLAALGQATAATASITKMSEGHRQRLEQVKLPLQQLPLVQASEEPAQFASRLFPALSRLTSYALEQMQGEAQLGQKTADFVYLSATLRTIAQDLLRHVKTIDLQNGDQAQKDALLMSLLQLIGNDLTIVLASENSQPKQITLLPLIAHYLFHSCALLVHGISTLSQLLNTADKS